MVLLADFAGRKLTPRKDVIATTKVLAGLLFTMLAYLAIVAVAAWRGGALVALAAAVLVPVSGYATLIVIERFRLLRRGLKVLAHRLRFRREVQRLRQERASLAADVGRLVDELRPSDLVPLFPRPGATA
jgi:small-conductance mechanosensitive channel